MRSLLGSIAKMFDLEGESFLDNLTLARSQHSCEIARWALGGLEAGEFQWGIDTKLA